MDARLIKLYKEIQELKLLLKREDIQRANITLKKMDKDIKKIINLEKRV